MMSIWTVIPARSGSQGLPGKNILTIGGKPMITWSIEAALASGQCNRVFVSTNSNDIAAIAMEAGAEIPFLRAENLSGPVASTDAVMVDFLRHFREVEYPDVLMVLQPTSPLRNSGHIQKAVKLFEGSDATSLMSVTFSRQSPYWTQVIQNGMLVPFMNDVPFSRRQDLPITYYPNGAIYMVTVNQLLETGHLHTDLCLPMVMTESESIDIDTELDFRVAELHMASQMLHGGEYVARS